ncbi:hypothetical protein [Ruminococcus sp.]|uniref:hypothetical protein n=1 Tax=Ruminococcus sp. TaxID=41978 RepID=UPI0025F9A117|nr:hypothetical protein [Ruminococcus sp.]
MKEKNIFDILGNAEDDSMERLTDKCPEITEEQLNKILSLSEKKYKVKKKEILKDRTEKDNNIKMTENDVVEGVERVRRPVWLAPLCSAASLILVAGIVLGSMTMFRKDKNGKIDTGVIEPAVTATTSQVSGTTNISTDKNGSTITTTVTTASSSETTDKGGDTVVVTDGSGTVDELVKGLAGQWKYQESQYNFIPGSITEKGTVVINEDGTYSYNGTNETGTVKIGVEEFGGSSLKTVSFYNGSSYSFGGYYRDNEWISLGNGGVSRLVRGSKADTSKDAEYISYQNTAKDLIEKYYDTHYQIMFRFPQYRNMNDTITFNLKDPNIQDGVRDVTYARITGKGLELNSKADVENYARRTYSDSLAAKQLEYLNDDYAVISDTYKNGDHIEETGVALEDLLVFKNFIIYKGNMYVNTSSVQAGWLGYTAADKPIIIKDITSTSFRAYAPGIWGENNMACDIVDFVFEPSVNGWRINNLQPDNYSVYGENLSDYNN